MKVLKAAHRLSGRVTCYKCGSELEFTNDDIQTGYQLCGYWEREEKYDYIECPICKAKIEISDLDSVMPWAV